MNCPECKGALKQIRKYHYSPTAGESQTETEQLCEKCQIVWSISAVGLLLGIPEELLTKHFKH